MLGSRFLGDPLAGGMPRWKYVSNRFLTGVENLAFGLHLSEYHTGFRAYSRAAARNDPLSPQQRRLRLRPGARRPGRGDARMRIGEIAVPTRYFKEASSVNFRRSVIYGLSTLRVILRFMLHRLRRPSLPQARPRGRRPPGETRHHEPCPQRHRRPDFDRLRLPGLAWRRSRPDR